MFLAVLLRYRPPHFSWRYRDLLTALCAVTAALLCVLLLSRVLATPTPREAPTGAPAIEVDMRVSAGNMVELWVNDWQHPSERLPVVAGERHVYRFENIPREITLIRLDPTEHPGSRIVIYSLTVKSGERTIRQYPPAELKTWKLVNFSPPTEEDGGLVLLDTNDDPILWTPTTVHLPGVQAPVTRWLERLRSYLPWLLLLAAVSLPIGLRRATGNSRLSTLLSIPCPDLGPILITSWCALLMVLLAAGTTVYLQNRHTGGGAGVEVDMLVSRGRAVELWVNDWQHPPERLPVVPGQRHVYRFTSLPRQIRLLRLDPTDLPDATVVLYGLAIRSQNQVYLQLGPAELKGWTRANFSEPEHEAGGLLLRDTNDDPMLWGPTPVQLPGNFLPALASTLTETPDAPFLLAICAFLLALLARMSTSGGRLQAVLIALVSCAAYPVVLLVRKLHFLPPPVTVAVGYANYHGFAKTGEYVASFTLLLISILLGYGFARLADRWTLEEVTEMPSPSRPWRYVWLIHLAVFALLFLDHWPNLLGVFSSMSTEVHPYVDWDHLVVLHWADLVNSGLRPFRDFWFPYSGAYIYLLPFPVGIIASVLHFTVSLWILYWSLFLVTERRVMQALAIFGLILTPVMLGMLPEWNRYLTAVDVVLLYVAVYDTRRFDSKLHLPFALFTGYAFFLEPTQVIYAGAGIAVHTLLSVASHFAGASFRGLFRDREWRDRLAASVEMLKQRFVYAGLPLLAGVSGALLIYAVNGMLPGLWNFEKSIGDQGDYGALPSDILRWVLPELQPDTVFLLMFLLTSYAVYRSFRMKGRPDILGAALVVSCFAAFLAMQKQILRPHNMTQVRIFPYVAVLIFGLIVWRERRPASRIVLAGLMGCILGIAVHQGMVHDFIVQDFEESPGKLAGSIEVLRHHRQEFAAANARLYSRAAFVGYDEENAVVDNLVQASGLHSEDTFYVLGDSAVFYMLLNQPPPFIANSYNDSPLYEQQKVLDWFHRKNPRFVIWKPQDSGFDLVPHLVRLPLLYGYVVEHYQWLKTIGPYEILERMPPGRTADLEYWRRTLGDRVDLGYVPGRARLSEYATCGAEVAHCDAVLVVKYPASRPVPNSRVTVDIDAPGGPLRIQFNAAPGERQYVVNLNRVWFWNLLAKSPAPRITAEDPSAQVEMNYRSERSPVLY